MLQRFLAWIRQVINRVFDTGTVQQSARVNVEISNEMISAIEMWDAMYRNKPYWMSSTTIPLGLSAAVAGEMARLVTLELKSEISGSARADYLQEQYKNLLSRLQAQAELACALGGMAFKPYPTADGRILVDCVPADRFFPTGFDASGRLAGGVFVDRYSDGKRFYTRFECHGLENTAYTIRNIAYMSYDRDTIGTSVALNTVPTWAGLEEEIVIAGVEKPLFGYFRVPNANNIDRDSPLGVSVYSRAVDTIRQADEQWNRMLWEFQGTELALDISSAAFEPDGNGGVKIPKRYQRLFRALDVGEMERPLYQVFSPAIREEPIYKGFQHILQRIEFQCGLAYGTLSDPQTVEKTAEEIKTSKQRSYATVASLQTALQTALTDAVYGMDVWATINNMAPRGIYEMSFAWDDSIVVDSDKEFSQRMQLVNANMLRKELVLAWYFGCSEEEALSMMPAMQGDPDPFRLNDA